jgi:hypothetical protein
MAVLRRVLKAGALSWLHALLKDSGRKGELITAAAFVGMHVVDGADERFLLGDSIVSGLPPKTAAFLADGNLEFNGALV